MVVRQSSKDGKGTESLGCCGFLRSDEYAKVGRSALGSRYTSNIVEARKEAVIYF